MSAVNDRHRVLRLYRWHQRVQLDICLARARLGFLCLGWTWRRDGHRPVAYWSPDATPTHARARGPWRRAGL